MNILEKESNFASAVIYSSNAEKTISSFLSEIYNYLYSHFNNFEIIIVDDCSNDNTISTVKEFSLNKKNNVFSIVHMSFPQGLEKAMNAGIDLAIGDFVFEFDSTDYLVKEEILNSSYQRILTGFDILSVRSSNRKISSKFFYFILNKYSNNQYLIGSDIFRILSRRAINRVSSLSAKIHYRKSLYANSGLKNEILTIKSLRKEKKFSSLKTNRQETALSTLIIFTDIAYKTSLNISILMMIASLLTAIYTLVFFFIERSIEGFTTMMLFLTGSFFGVFLFFSLIIKYLSILVNLVFLKEKYLVQSIEKVKGI